MDDTMVHWVLGITSGTAVLGVAGLVAWIIRQAGTVMTREEHSNICDGKTQMVMEGLKKLSSEIKERDERASDHRDKIDGKIDEMRTDLGDVIADVRVLKDRDERRTTVTVTT